MSMNPGLMGRMAQSRAADLQRAAAQRPGGTRRPVTHRAAGIRPAPGPTNRVRPSAVRGAIGWSLVAVGLRLAVPRARSGSVR